MKINHYSFNLKKLLFLPLLVLVLFSGCQDEATEIINPPQEEIIDGNSLTASLMSRTASNDGSIDNIIDYANCLEVVLPVTITANGVTITIESVTDFDALEALLDAFTNDADEVVITFPITVILNDYSELVINNQAELEAQIENCNGENEPDDDIECIDFQYPISFSIYNTDFQVTEVVTIDNDEALYLFLDSLNGPVIASLNFPVALVLANGETVVVNNNQELDFAISEAEDDCDEDDDYDYNDDDFDCNEENVELALKECYWYLENSLFNNIVPDLYYFEENFTVSVYNSISGNLTTVGTWAVSSNADDLYLTLGFDSSPFDLIALTWEIVDCDDDRFTFVNGNDIMVMEQSCDAINNGPFACFDSINASLVECDELNDGFEEFNLNLAFDNCITPNFVMTYHVTQSEAETGLNAIANPEAYTNIAIAETIYVRVEIANSTDFQVYPLQLILEDCTNYCTEGDVDGILQECVWTITSYSSDTSFNIFDINFETNQNMTITSSAETYTGNWSTYQNAAGQVVVVFSNISGGNVQVLNGEFVVVECTAEQMIFHDINNSANELVLDRDCI